MRLHQRELVHVVGFDRSHPREGNDTERLTHQVRVGIPEHRAHGQDLLTDHPRPAVLTHRPVLDPPIGMTVREDLPFGSHPRGVVVVVGRVAVLVEHRVARDQHLRDAAVDVADVREGVENPMALFVHHTLS